MRVRNMTFLFEFRLIVAVHPCVDYLASDWCCRRSSSSAVLYNDRDRDSYAAAKREAASQANAGGEHVMQYNARKQQVIRDIYHKAFAAAGLLQE